MKATKRQRRIARRRGSAYLAVLGVATVITAASIGVITAARVQSRNVDAARDIADARFAAQSGLEYGREWIALTSAWRTSGITNGTIGVGSYSVAMTVTDTSDGNLSNLPLDPVLLTSTATKSSSVCQALSETLVASATPYDALGYAIHTAGQLHVLANHTLIANQPVSAGTEFKAEGTMQGSVVANKITIANNAQVYGTTTTVTTTRSLPSTDTTSAAYSAIGSTITVPANNQLSGFALGPGYNPYGSVNANGVYVINTNNPLTIQNCRIVGTLVIINKKAVTISGSVSITPARSDFPALIITGDANFNYATTSLSEATLGINLNPLGVPLNGLTDSLLTSTFPSEIDGLVEVGGKLDLQGVGLVRGLIIDESTAGDAVKLDATQFQVVYDPKLFTKPPNYYTTAINMVVQSGSIKPITH